MVLNYFKQLYSGRINRLEYLAGFGIFTILIIISVLLLMSFYEHGEESGPYLVLPAIFIEVYAFIFLSSLYIRRAHDHGKSGWYLLIPDKKDGILFKLFWLTLKGNQDSNSYGAMPKIFSLKNLLGLK